MYSLMYIKAFIVNDIRRIGISDQSIKCPSIVNKCHKGHNDKATLS